MRMTRHCWILPALVVVLGAGSWATAQEERDLKPEIAQLLQSVSERLEAAADRLGLTAEQRSKMREVRTSYAEKYRALRDKRRELLRSELSELGPILTPEQREKAKELAEDRIEARQSVAADRDWPKFTEVCETVAERIHAAGSALGVTEEQRKKIREARARFVEAHHADRAERRQLVEDEFQAIAAILSPEQREKARDAIEDRIVRAALVTSIAERLETGAEALELGTEQRQRITAARRPLAEKFRQHREERRDLLRDELQAISAVLTPEQREKVKDFCADRVIVIEAAGEGRSLAEALKNLRETVAERMEVVADKLGLTAEQRNRIRDIHTSYAEKFKNQRSERRALRQQEMEILSVILTPEQRQKVKDWVEDQTEPTTR